MSSTPRGTHSRSAISGRFISSAAAARLAIMTAGRLWAEQDESLIGHLDFEVPPDLMLVIQQAGQGLSASEPSTVMSQTALPHRGTVLTRTSSPPHLMASSQSRSPPGTSRPPRT